MSFEWPRSSLTSLCLQIADCPHSTPVWMDKGVVVLRNQNIKNGKLDLSSPSFTDEENYQKRVRRAAPEAGDIVITREAPMGDVCQIPKGLRCCLGQRQVLLKPNPEKIDSRYLLFVLQSSSVQRQIGWNEGTGSTVSNLRIPVLESLQIEVPPLHIQNEIAQILGALDDRIALLRETNTTLESIAQALFKSWFVDFDSVHANAGTQAPSLPAEIQNLFPSTFVESPLGLVPEGWAVEPLDKIADFLNGLALQKFPPTGVNDLPVIKIAQLRKGDTVGADQANRNLKSEYVVHDGDILFSWSGSLEIEIWCGGEGALNQHLFKVSSSRFQKWFFYLWTKFHLANFKLIAASKATTMGHIQRKHLSEALTVVPPNELMLMANELFEPLLEQFINNALAAKNLARMRDSLLPRLISGQLRLPDAQELAEVLA